MRLGRIGRLLLALAVGSLAVACGGGGGGATNDAPSGGVDASLLGLNDFLSSESNVDLYMLVDGAPGESTDSKHTDWIDLLELGWSQDVGTLLSGPSGGHGAQRVSTPIIKVSKPVDKASPKLYLYNANGTRISRLAVQVTRSVGDKPLVYEMILENVRVRSIGQVLSVDGAAEVVEFFPGEMTLIYHQLDPKTGKDTGTVESHWSYDENTGGR